MAPMSNPIAKVNSSSDSVYGGSAAVSIGSVIVFSISFPARSRTMNLPTIPWQNGLRYIQF